MVRVDHVEIINQPVDVVFAALADPDREAAWQPAVIATSHEPPGELRVGSQVSQTRKLLGREMTSVGEIYAYEPNRRLASRSVAGESPVIHSVYELDPVDGATRLSFTLEVSGGVSFRLIEPILQRNLDPEVKDRFGRLKRLLEEEE